MVLQLRLIIYHIFHKYSFPTFTFTFSFMARLTWNRKFASVKIMSSPRSKPSNDPRTFQIHSYFSKNSLKLVYSIHTFEKWVKYSKRSRKMMISSENPYVNKILYMNSLWKRFSTKTRRNNNFHQNVTSVGKKLEKRTNGNTTVDKESIVEIIKAVFKEEFQKQQHDI